MPNPLLLLGAAILALLVPIGFAISRSWDRRVPPFGVSSLSPIERRRTSRRQAAGQPSMMPTMAA